MSRPRKQVESRGGEGGSHRARGSAKNEQVGKPGRSRARGGKQEESSFLPNQMQKQPREELGQRGDLILPFISQGGEPTLPESHSWQGTRWGRTS